MQFNRNRIHFRPVELCFSFYWISIAAEFGFSNKRKHEGDFITKPLIQSEFVLSLVVDPILKLTIFVLFLRGFFSLSLSSCALNKISDKM